MLMQVTKIILSSHLKTHMTHTCTHSQSGGYWEEEGFQKEKERE